MIACPSCKISFSPRHTRCPRCQAYEARLAERIEYLAVAAETALDRGVAPADVEAMLVEEGVPRLEACETVATKARKVKLAERSYGVVRLLGGSVILLAGMILVLAGMFAGLRITGIHAVYLGLLIGVAGARPFALGLYSVLTGREKR
jgi:hypothetical protein